MEKLKLEDTKKEKKNNLINLCTSDFSEAFINWMHLKCIRVFVESILRYGVPPNFFVVLIKVEGHERKVLKTLKEEVSVLDEDVAMYDDTNSSIASSGTDFYSFVLIPINTGDLKI